MISYTPSLATSQCPKFADTVKFLGTIAWQRFSQEQHLKLFYWELIKILLILSHVSSLLEAEFICLCPCVWMWSLVSLTLNDEHKLRVYKLNNFNMFCPQLHSNSHSTLQQTYLYSEKLHAHKKWYDALCCVWTWFLALQFFQLSHESLANRHKSGLRQSSNNFRI